MSQSARKRGGSRRIQPYAWLGAGAVTVGMGVALVGGTAVAFADAGADSAGAATTSESAGAAGATSAKSDAAGPRRKVLRPSRAAAAGADNSVGSPASAAQGRKSRATAAPELPDAALDVGDVEAPGDAEIPGDAQTPGDVDYGLSAPLPAAAVAVEPVAPAAEEATAAVATASPKRAVRASRGAAVAVPAQTAPDGVTVAADPAAVEVADPSSDPAPAAAVPGPAADPAPVMTSWLPGAGGNPGTQIVPGSHVQLALQEIADAQGILTQQTWGSGNILAGVVAIVPQVFLAGASLSLTAWGATNPGVQDFLAGTAGIPLIHQVAQITLLSNMLLPSLAEISMGGAALFMPLVGVFGADVSAAEAQVAAARQDGKVYAVVPVRMVATTQPVVGVSVNGGSAATLLVDTGASGLVTTEDKVGAGDLGPMTGEGNSCFSGGICYHYETYNTTVDLGGGAVTTAPVNIVTDNDEYPDSVAVFKDFFSWGADGILGVGANTAGPGPAPIPTALMPGELSNGMLLYQNAWPFGLGGFMVLGPNALPTRVSVPGAPDAYVTVSVNGGAKTDAGAIIDSGGVYGTLNTANDPTGTTVGQNLPAGTTIAVYTADGATLLYTYTTGNGAYGTPVIGSGLMNTGNAPFAQNPIYLNYGFDNPYGIGSTDFSIW